MSDVGRRIVDEVAHRRARAGVFGIFWINGFLLGMWVVHIPAIETKIGISHSTLGTLLLALAAGAIVGMQVSDPRRRGGATVRAADHVGVPCTLFHRRRIRLGGGRRNTRYRTRACADTRGIRSERHRCHRCVLAVAIRRGATAYPTQSHDTGPRALLRPVAVVRYGALVAAMGMLLVVTSGEILLTLTGWGLFGLGLSGSVPQIFSTAGNLGSGASGTNMSRVVGLGYLGFLAGPAVIGAITVVVPLTSAMLVPLACVLVAAVAAGTVRRTPHTAGRDHSSISSSVQDLDA